MRRSSLNKRILLVKILLLLWSLGIVFRLFQIQILKQERMKLLVAVQHEERVELIPRRGKILDRRGRLLAISLPVYSAFLHPPWPSKKELVEMGKVLGLSDRQLERLKKKMGGKRKFLWLKRKLSEKEYLELKALKIESLGFQKENKRFYPHRTLACHLLGGVGIDEQGLAGVEFFYDKEVGGEKGEAVFLMDAAGEPIKKILTRPMIPGADLVLTIDTTIQLTAEEVLARTVRKYRAKRGAVVVMNPYNGEILAMASYPPYDPNFYSSYFRRKKYYLRNNAISFSYEPGSTVKFVPIAAALELGLLDYNSTIYCEEGQVRVLGVTIRDHKPFGLLSLRDVLVYSSNVGAIKVATKLSGREFYRYLLKFGFGRKTRIDLPGEEAGLLLPYNRWYRSARAFFAIGQGIAVTPIQLAVATSVIANGGYLVRPHVVKEIRKGSRVKKISAASRRVLSGKVARQIKEMMLGVVERGTGVKARLGWIKVAGKTGTAEKLNGNGKRYTASFVGFAPFERPELVIVVVIDEPRGAHFGGEVAAPAFRELAEFSLMQKNIFPEMVRR